MKKEIIEFLPTDVLDISSAMHVKITGSTIVIKICEEIQSYMELRDFPVKKIVDGLILDENYFQNEIFFDHLNGILITRKIKERKERECFFYEFDPECSGEIVIYLTNSKQEISTMGMSVSLNINVPN